MLNSFALALPARREHYTVGREIFTRVGSSDGDHILSNYALVVCVVRVVYTDCVSSYTSFAGRKSRVVLLGSGQRFVVILNVV